VCAGPIVPPPIGRFSFLDLRPGRSFVEYALSRGLQVFLLSWRNPTAEQADWDLDTYATRILTALLVVKDITGSEDVNTLGFCAGGMLMTTVLNHLAATADDTVHSAAYAVTLLELARRSSRRDGVITARSMGTVGPGIRRGRLRSAPGIRHPQR